MSKVKTKPRPKSTTNEDQKTLAYFWRDEIWVIDFKKLMTKVGAENIELKVAIAALSRYSAAVLGLKTADDLMKNITADDLMKNISKKQENFLCRVLKLKPQERQECCIRYNGLRAALSDTTEIVHHWNRDEAWPIVGVLRSKLRYLDSTYGHLAPCNPLEGPHPRRLFTPFFGFQLPERSILPAIFKGDADPQTAISVWGYRNAYQVARLALRSLKDLTGNNLEPVSKFLYRDQSAPARSEAIDFMVDFQPQKMDVLKAPNKLKDDFQDLRSWTTSKLKGKQRRVMEEVMERGGKCKLADIAVAKGVEWASPNDAFNAVKREINKKLKTGKQPFHLERHDNEARLVAVKSRAKVPVS